MQAASVETMAPMKSWFGEGCSPEPLPAENTSISVPLGVTPIRLPSVNTFWLLIATGVDQCAPPSVDREKGGCPRKAKEWNAFTFGSPPGCRERSHTAYT